MFKGDGRERRRLRGAKLHCEPQFLTDDSTHAKWGWADEGGRTEPGGIYRRRGG